MTAGSAEFVAVVPADELADGTYVVIEARGLSLLVANLDGAFFAVENRCSHAGSPLGGGRMKRARITCPLHGAVYDVRTGASLAATLAPRGLRTFETRVKNGVVLARLG